MMKSGDLTSTPPNPVLVGRNALAFAAAATSPSPFKSCTNRLRRRDERVRARTACAAEMRGWEHGPPAPTSPGCHAGSAWRRDSERGGFLGDVGEVFSLPRRGGERGRWFVRRLQKGAGQRWKSLRRRPALRGVGRLAGRWRWHLGLFSCRDSTIFLFS